MQNFTLTRKAIHWAIGLMIVFVLGLWIAGNFNSLVGSKADVDNSWAQVETQYQRRFDLIGNLVESVKGSQLQEQTVFKSIADARKQYQAANGNSNQQAAAATQIESNVALIPKLQEAYPELKSNQNVQSLMKQLTDTENTIAGARDNYNKVATNYNKNVQSFPKDIFAGMFGFQKQSLFKADAGASQAPKVDFSTPATQPQNQTQPQSAQ